MRGGGQGGRMNRCQSRCSIERRVLRSGCFVNTRCSLLAPPPPGARPSPPVAWPRARWSWTATLSQLRPRLWRVWPSGLGYQCSLQSRSSETSACAGVEGAQPGRATCGRRNAPLLSDCALPFVSSCTADAQYERAGVRCCGLAGLLTPRCVPRRQGENRGHPGAEPGHSESHRGDYVRGGHSCAASEPLSRPTVRGGELCERLEPGLDASLPHPASLSMMTEGNGLDVND